MRPRRIAFSALGVGTKLLGLSEDWLVNSAGQFCLRFGQFVSGDFFVIGRMDGNYLRIDSHKTRFFYKLASKVWCAPDISFALMQENVHE